MSQETQSGSVAERPTEALRRWFSLKPVLLTLATFAVYAWLFGWKMTLLLMLGLLWHEIGHAYAMSRFGLGVAGFYFVPLVGLVVSPLRNWKTRRQEAIIALAGPAWGAVSVLLLVIPYWLTRDPIWAGAAGLLAMINGFNLLPINPLDGGRITKSVTWSVHPLLGIVLLGIGIAASVVLAVVWSPIFALVAFFSFLELRQDYRAWRQSALDQELMRDLGQKFYGAVVDRARVIKALREIEKTTDDSGKASKARDIAEFLSRPISSLTSLDRREIAWLSAAYLLLAAALVAAAVHLTSIQGLEQLLQAWK